MDNYTIDKQFNIKLWAENKGTQPKYFKDNYWFKEDSLGREGLAEELTSLVLSCSNVTDFVFYEQCKINDKTGCKSLNFLHSGEQFVTFQDLYKSFTGKEFSEDVFQIYDIQKRFDFVVDFIKKSTNLDCTRYLQDTFSIDMLIKNPDRHFGNLGVILTPSGTFRLAPIFDNGQGLYQNFQITPPFFEREEKEESLSSCTISGSFEMQVVTAENCLKIDYEKLFQKLEEYPHSIAKECLIFQLNKYKGMFAMISQEKTQEQEFEYT